MPPRKTTSAPRAPRSPVVPPAALAPGDAVRLPDGGEGVFVAQDGSRALLRVGTSHSQPYRTALDGLSRVDAVDETERHAKFRTDALRRGEI